MRGGRGEEEGRVGRPHHHHQLLLPVFRGARDGGGGWRCYPCSDPGATDSSRGGERKAGGRRERRVLLPHPPPPCRIHLAERRRETGSTQKPPTPPSSKREVEEEEEGRERELSLSQHCATAGDIEMRVLFNTRYMSSENTLCTNHARRKSVKESGPKPILKFEKNIYSIIHASLAGASIGMEKKRDLAGGKGRGGRGKEKTWNPFRPRIRERMEGRKGGRDARRELNGRRRGRRGSTLLAPILPRPKSEDQPNLPAHSSSGGKPDSRDALGGGEVGTCCEGGGEKRKELLLHRRRRRRRASHHHGGEKGGC